MLQVIGTAIKKEGRLNPHHAPLAHWVAVRALDDLFAAPPAPASAALPSAASAASVTPATERASRGAGEGLRAPRPPGWLKGWVRLMKLDVQGFECRALRGMAALLNDRTVQVTSFPSPPAHLRSTSR